MRSLLAFCFYLACPLFLISQTNIVVEAGPISYNNIDTDILDTYNVVISDCTSIQFSVDFNFSLPWQGSGNMESCDECVGGCACDPTDPASPGCGTPVGCWDFMWMQFFIGSNLVDENLIGDVGTTDFEQTGTYQTNVFCTDGETTADIEITNQNWGAGETNEFSNVTIICWEGIPSIATNLPVCAGQDLDLNGTATDESIITQWEWSNNGTGLIDDDQAQNTFATNVEDGEVYTLQVTDVNSCTATDEVIISLSSSNFDATWDTPLGGDVIVCEGACAGSDYTIEISIAGGTAPYDIALGGLPIPVFIPELPSNFITFCEGGIDVNLSSDPIEISIPSFAFDFQLELLSVTDANGCNGNIIGGFIDVMLQSQPAIDEPVVIEECLLAGETIDLTQYDTEIGNGEEVVWLATEDVTDLISTPSNYDISDGNPVYAVVGEDPCFSDIIEVELLSVVSPTITTIQTPLYNCGLEYELPEFDEVAVIDNGTNPQYYLDSGLTDGPYSPSSIVDVNRGSNEIYVYDESGPMCFNFQSFELISLTAPEIISPSGTIQECGSITLPIPIINNQDNLDFSYNTQPDGTGNIFLDGDVIAETDGISELYLIAINNIGTTEECQDTTHLTLSFLGGANFMAAIPDQICDMLILPPIIPASTSVAYFESLAGPSFQPGDTITFAESQAGINVLDTLYIYDPLISTVCSSIDTIVFEIGETPTLAVPFQTQFCDQGFLPPPSANNPNLQYATDRDFINLISPNIPLTESTFIYFRDSFPFPSGGACFAVDSFLMEIIEEPNAGQDSSIVICELTNQTLNIFDILGNPDTDGILNTDSNLSLIDPTNVNIVNIDVGNYTIDYEIDKPGCPPVRSQIMIEVVPPLNVGELNITESCSGAGTLDLPFLLGNPVTGGEWYIEDSSGSEIIVPDPTAWDISGLPEDTYRIIYNITGTTDNPYCANRSSVNSLTIVSDPNAGVDSTLTICQGYDLAFDFFDVLNNPELGGSYSILNTPPDLDLSDGTIVDLSVLSAGNYQITYTLEKPGCPIATSLIDIDVVIPFSPGVPSDLAFCNTSGTIELNNQVVGNDPIESWTITNPNAAIIYAANSPMWEFTDIIPGVYEVSYNLVVQPNLTCQELDGSYTITILDALNAGSDSALTICKGQTIDMTSLLSSDAILGGTFLQDEFPVFNPEEWTPVSINDVVEVQYIIEASSTSCLADTAFVTVSLSDNLSAGSATSNNLVCSGEEIQLSDYLEDETPGGNFYLGNDYNNPIPGNRILIADENYTYIVQGAPGCDSDTLEFDLVVTDPIRAVGTYSSKSLCYSDQDCIILTIDANVDGAIDIFVTGDTNNLENAAFPFFLTDNQTSIYFCPSPTWHSGPLGGPVDTFYMGNHPEIGILLRQVYDSSSNCSPYQLNQLDTINIYSDYIFELDTTICDGELVEFEGEQYASTHNFSGATRAGCDSIIDIQIATFNLIENDIEQDLCEGQSYDNISGYNFTTNIDTTIILEGGSALGCDSTINLSLKFTDKAVGPLELDLCYGDSIEIDGVKFIEGMTSAEVPAPMPSTFGCDSATMVTVTFFDEVSPGTFITSICEDETFPLGDMVYNASNLSGLSTLAGAAVGGCDSMVNVTIDLYPAIYNFSSDLCANDTIFIGGDAYHAGNLTGLSSTQETTINGCDSIVNVQLNLILLEERIFRPELCDDQDFMINGETYNFSNPVGEEFISNTMGCDSLIIIDIKDSRSAPVDLEFELSCFSQDTMINGVLYYWDNLTGSTILSNSAGCDSIVNVTFILTTPNLVYDIDYCEGSPLMTVIITEEGRYTLPFITTLPGYDTIVTALPFEIDMPVGYTTVEVEDECGERVAEQIGIDPGIPVTVELTSQEIGNNSFQLGIKSEADFTSYLWSPADLLNCSDCPDPIANITQEETISVELISSEGCSFPATITLNADSIIVPPIDSSVRVFLPNTISLDEQSNQMFYPFADNDNLIIDAMHIYDKWGNAVFINEAFLANSEAEGWDGRRAGKGEVEQGVYVYVIEYIDAIYGPQLLHGTITVLR